MVNENIFSKVYAVYQGSNLQSQFQLLVIYIHPFSSLSNIYNFQFYSFLTHDLPKTKFNFFTSEVIPSPVSLFNYITIVPLTFEMLGSLAFSLFHHMLKTSTNHKISLIWNKIYPSSHLTDTALTSPWTFFTPLL